MATCEHCGSSELRAAMVRSAFWHDDQLVVVEGIPALICSACQEQFYDDRTAVLLDLLRGAGFPPAQASGEVRAMVFSLQAWRKATEGGL